MKTRMNSASFHHLAGVAILASVPTVWGCSGTPFQFEGEEKKQLSEYQNAIIAQPTAAAEVLAKRERDVHLLRDELGSILRERKTFAKIVTVSAPEKETLEYLKTTYPDERGEWVVLCPQIVQEGIGGPLAKGLQAGIGGLAGGLASLADAHTLHLKVRLLDGATGEEVASGEAQTRSPGASQDWEEFFSYTSGTIGQAFSAKVHPVVENQPVLERGRGNGRHP